MNKTAVVLGTMAFWGGIVGTGAAIGAAVADRRPALGAFVGGVLAQSAILGAAYALMGNPTGSTGTAGAIGASGSRMHLGSVEAFP